MGASPWIDETGSLARTTRPHDIRWPLGVGMMDRHDVDVLNCYGLDILAVTERHAVEAHLVGCAGCRAELAQIATLRTLLDQVPVEAFLDGPPDDADLLPRRAMRQVRKQASHQVRRWAIPVAAAMIALVLAMGAGDYLGRQSRPVISTATGNSTPSGTQVFTAADPTSHVGLTAVITPEPGWVKIEASFVGVTPGLACQLVAQPRTGAPRVVLSWIAPTAQPTDGVLLAGAITISSTDLAALSVTTLAGQHLVSVHT